MSRPIRIEMMAITTSSSIKVKPPGLPGLRVSRIEYPFVESGIVAFGIMGPTSRRYILLNRTVPADHRRGNRKAKRRAATVRRHLEAQDIGSGGWCLINEDLVHHMNGKGSALFRR